MLVGTMKWLRGDSGEAVSIPVYQNGDGDMFVPGLDEMADTFKGPILAAFAEDEVPPGVAAERFADMAYVLNSYLEDWVGVGDDDDDDDDVVDIGEILWA